MLVHLLFMTSHHSLFPWSTSAACSCVSRAASLFSSFLRSLPSCFLVVLALALCFFVFQRNAWFTVDAILRQFLELLKKLTHFLRGGGPPLCIVFQRNASFFSGYNFCVSLRRPWPVCSFVVVRPRCSASWPECSRRTRTFGWFCWLRCTSHCIVCSCRQAQDARHHGRYDSERQLCGVFFKVVDIPVVTQRLNPMVPPSGRP